LCVNPPRHCLGSLTRSSECPVAEPALLDDPRQARPVGRGLSWRATVGFDANHELPYAVAVGTDTGTGQALYPSVQDGALRAS
jgi:hypothetical protein